MHKEKHHRRITATGTKDKTPVIGIIERGGEIRAKVIPTRRKHIVQQEIRENVKKGSAIYTDALLSYQGLKFQDYQHEVIDHARCYVQGRVHTNTLENFWSLLKRGIRGTYVSVEPFHLFRYLDEQALRYNLRKKPMNDCSRFEYVASHILNKRLTYQELTGKTGTTPSLPN